MHTFKIVEENENPLLSKIEMGNLTTTFTVDDLLSHKDYVEKVIRENTAQISFEDAQNKMVEEIYPEVKNIPEDKYVLVASYLGRKIQRPATEQLLKTSKETLEKYTQRLADIKEKLGIDAEWETPGNETPEITETETTQE
jgi:hypothetical protein